MIRILVIAFLLTGLAAGGWSQDRTVKLIKDPGLDQLITFYASHVNSIEERPGYRIQILAGTSRDKAYREESNFKFKYPGYKTYLTYNSPYFKVRVGDFEEKLEAYRFLQHLKGSYPGAFMVEEVVEVR